VRDALVQGSLIFGAVVLVLGIPAIAGLAVLRRRRMARRQLAGATPFRCKARIEFGDVPGIRAHYPRRWQRGAWIHDVLLFERGWLTPRLVPHAVESTGTLEGSDQGREQTSLRLYLDSGAVIRVTAHVREKTRLVGPFLMAELAASPNNRLMRGHR
jgi:hypothetical protein